MTTTERDILIAKTMGLELQHKNAGYFYEYVDDHGHGIYARWNPAENAEQREKIEDWVIEKGYEINTHREEDHTWVGIYEINRNLTFIPSVKVSQGINKSKSTAFFEAVGELCETIKNQKQ